VIRVIDAISIDDRAVVGAAAFEVKGAEWG
jgi:hypothetical protein